MKIDIENFKPFIGLIYYGELSRYFFIIKTIDPNYETKKAEAEIISYTVTETIAKVICAPDYEISNGCPIFGEPDFPIDRLPEEFKVTKFKAGNRYFRNSEHHVGILDIKKVTYSSFSFEIIYDFLDLETNTFRTDLSTRSNASEEQLECYYKSFLLLDTEENIEVEDGSCKHLNKKILNYGCGHKKYLFCSDCKEDLGDI